MTTAALITFADSDVSVWRVVVAALVVVASLFVARAAYKAVIRLSGRLEGVPGEARHASARVAGYFTALVGVGIALSVLGADVQPLQTAAIIAAVVAFIVLRGVAGQFIAGIVLRTTHPYRVGDHVESAGHLGVVRQLTSFATLIETYDGRLVHVPHMQMVSNPIVNRTATGGLRTDVEVRATWSGGITELLAMVRAAATATPDVLAQPETIVFVRSAEPGRVTAIVRPWHDPELDSDIVAGAVAESVARRLAERGVEATVVTPPPPPPFTPSPAV